MRAGRLQKTYRYGINAMFNTFVRQYSSWRRYRSTYNELMKLSNRELDDLGINRGDIDSVAKNLTR